MNFIESASSTNVRGTGSNFPHTLKKRKYITHTGSNLKSSLESQSNKKRKQLEDTAEKISIPNGQEQIQNFQKPLAKSRVKKNARKADVLNSNSHNTKQGSKKRACLDKKVGEEVEESEIIEEGEGKTAPENFLLNPKNAVPSLGENLKLIYPTGIPEVMSIVKSALENGAEVEALPTKLRGFKKYLNGVNGSGIPSDLQVCKINDQMGLGVFRKLGQKTLKSKEFIGIYTGKYEILPIDDVVHRPYACDILAKVILSKEEAASIGLDESEKAFCIIVNAQDEGNFTSLINHSYEPNVEATLFKIGDKIFPAILSIKPIKAGEQLLMNYDQGYWLSCGITPASVNPQTYQLSRVLPPVEEKIDLAEKFLKENRLTACKDTYGDYKKYSIIQKGRHAGQYKRSEQVDRSIALFQESVEETGTYRGLTLKEFSTSKMGVFLQADKPAIPPRAIIGMYAGEYKMISENDFNDIDHCYDLNSFEDPSTKTSYYLQVDSSNKTNFTAKINHSKFSNVESMLYRMKNGQLVTLFRTTKRIEPGHQLLANYGEGYVKTSKSEIEEMKSDTYVLNDKGKVIKS